MNTTGSALMISARSVVEVGYVNATGSDFIARSEVEVGHVNTTDGIMHARSVVPFGCAHYLLFWNSHGGGVVSAFH